MRFPQVVPVEILVCLRKNADATLDEGEETRSKDEIQVVDEKEYVEENENDVEDALGIQRVPAGS